MEPTENGGMPKRQDGKYQLPWGFRFHPTDEELINCYLVKKVLDSNFSALAIAEVDMNKCEPWDLPRLAKMGETEWYFFVVRDRKYPTGDRTNRATQAGYWKATGKDREIFIGDVTIAMKKTLVFYKGRAPKGVKTNWVMHEYRLEANALPQAERPSQGDWTVCRVFEKGNYGKKFSHAQNVRMTGSLGSEPALASRVTPVMDSSPFASEMMTTPGELSQVTCFTDPNQSEDWNNAHDDIVEISSAPMPSVISPVPASPASFGFASEIPVVPNYQSTKIANQIGNSQFTPNYCVPPEPSMMSMVTDNNGLSAMQNQNLNQNQKAEFSQGRDFDAEFSSLMNNNDMFLRFFGNQGQSSGSADIGSLWNY